MSKARALGDQEPRAGRGRGVRFAPSPTGTFHLGNLRTAYVSWKWAQALGEPWVVRFEDIDAPRVVAGARERQLADMAALGLHPYTSYIQSAARARHEELFRAAVAGGQVYACACSRKEVLAGLASAPHGPDAVYTGQCRREPVRTVTPGREVGWRFRAEGEGARDFLVARTASLDPADGFVPAYPWACAIDDYDGGYPLLVRAWDLAHAVEAQRAVQAWVARHEGRAWTAPAVFHATLVTADDGSRLEKRTRGVTLAEWRERASPEELVRRLEASLDPAEFRAEELSPARVWGEARRSATLRDLMLS